MVCRLFKNYFVSVGKRRDNISAIFNIIGAIFGQKSIFGQNQVDVFGKFGSIFGLKIDSIFWKSAQYSGWKSIRFFGKIGSIFGLKIDSIFSHAKRIRVGQLWACAVGLPKHVALLLFCLSMESVSFGDFEGSPPWEEPQTINEESEQDPVS